MTRARLTYLAANAGLWLVAFWIGLLTIGTIGAVAKALGGSEITQGFAVGVAVWAVPKLLARLADAATDSQRGRG